MNPIQVTIGTTPARLTMTISGQPSDQPAPIDREPVGNPNLRPLSAYYTSLTPQPLNCRFVFNPLALIDCRHGEPECSGTVQIMIQVAKQQSGPFETGINTTTSTFEGRRLLYPSAESLALRDELYRYMQLVTHHWHELKQAGHIVTGEMIYQQLSQQQHDSV